MSLITRFSPIVLVAAIPLAACGSSSSGASKGAAGNSNKALAFAKCMRSHGVSNFPDPTGGRLNLQVRRTPNSTEVNGVEVNTPAFQTAMSACKADLPNGGTPSAPSAAQRQAALQFAHCMRSHGVSNFPDPQVSGGGVIIKAAGKGIQLNSPAVQSAQQACQPMLSKAFSRGPA